MANEIQYVGARYVPKFASPSTWQSGTSYEALTIVQYNNASYTSKVPVPATVGNPAQNPEYWVLTGNYNGQVESYRQETDTVKGELDGVKSSVNTNTENITRLNSFHNSHDWNVLIIGDSYAAAGEWKKWPVWFKEQIPLSDDNYHLIAESGYGFNSGRNFNTLLNDHMSEIPNKDTITHVICCGGANDFGVDGNELANNIHAFRDNVQKNFPNAEIYIGAIGACVPGAVTDSAWVNRATQANWDSMIYYYRASCQSYGIHFLEHAYKWCQPAFMYSDNIHPNEIGGLEISYMIINSLLDNGIMSRGYDISVASSETAKMPISDVKETKYTGGVLVEFKLSDGKMNGQSLTNPIRIKVPLTLIRHHITTVIPTIISCSDGGFLHGAIRVDWDNGDMLFTNEILNKDNNGYYSGGVDQIVTGRAYYFSPY